MTAIVLFRARGTIRTILTGAAGTACRAFTTTMGKTKADKEHNDKKQWCDVGFHG